MPIKNTLEAKLTYRIKRSTTDAFVRQDFADLGGYDQIGRILKYLVQKGFLIRIAYGIYAKTKTSTLSNQLIPTKPLPELTKEAFQKLGVSILPSKAETAYNRGDTTQVPTGRVLGINKRVSRKISFRGNFIAFEKVA